MTFSFRPALAALLIAATTATTALPTAALARSDLFMKRSVHLAEQVDVAGKDVESVSKYTWKCGYVTKRKSGKYSPRHVIIKRYKTQVNCYDVLKGKKPVVVRGFKNAVKDSEIRKSVSDSANRT